MSLFRKPELNKIWYKPGRLASPAKPKAKGKKPAAGLDVDVAALESSFAQAEADRLENSYVVAVAALAPDGEGPADMATLCSTRIIDTPPPSTRRSASAAKTGKTALPTNKGASTAFTVANSQSQPSSPALNGIGSPSLGPVTDKARQSRSAVVHELAVRNQPYDTLWERYDGDEADFKAALEKVADLDGDSQTYALKKLFWRELDVWNYRYDTDDDRQLAIDNARQRFDRMRLSTSEPEWDRLLPREERGTGKSLSKVQAVIERGSPALPPPKIKVQKADDSSSVGSGSPKDKDDRRQLQRRQQRRPEEAAEGRREDGPVDVAELADLADVADPDEEGRPAAAREEVAVPEEPPPPPRPRRRRRARPRSRRPRSPAASSPRSS